MALVSAFQVHTWGSRTGALTRLPSLRAFCCPQDVGPKNKEGNTPLHWACLNGHKEVRRAGWPRSQYMDITARVYIFVAQTVPSLAFAAKLDHLVVHDSQVVQFLMERGASPSAINKWVLRPHAMA